MKRIFVLFLLQPDWTACLDELVPGLGAEVGRAGGDQRHPAGPEQLSHLAVHHGAHPHRGQPLVVGQQAGAPHHGVGRIQGSHARRVVPLSSEDWSPLLMELRWTASAYLFTIAAETRNMPLPVHSLHLVIHVKLVICRTKRTTHDKQNIAITDIGIPFKRFAIF